MTDRSFWVNVGGLRRAPGSRLSDAVSGKLPGLAVTESWVPDDATVTVEADLEVSSGNSIMVHAVIRAPWIGECRRCLEEAQGSLVADVRELFEVKNDPEESYRLNGDQLDLAPLARDAVLLELPVAPLCQDGCRGLCPNCGVNRNEGECVCPPDLQDPTDPFTTRE